MNDDIIINIDNTNLSAGIFWRNNNLSLKDALINSIQLENRKNLEILMEEYWSDTVWTYIPELFKEFETSPFWTRFINWRNLMAIKKLSMEWNQELSDRFKKLYDERNPKI